MNILLWLQIYVQNEGIKPDFKSTIIASLWVSAQFKKFPKNKNSTKIRTIIKVEQTTYPADIVRDGIAGRGRARSFSSLLLSVWNQPVTDIRVFNLLNTSLTWKQRF